MLLDEEKFIARAKAGDVGAFNRLVLAHQDAVYNLALRMMGDPAAAGDATQEAFVSAYGAIGRYKTGNFKGWLLRIVNNKCLDALRKQNRHIEPSIDAIVEEHESPRFLMDSAETPEQSAQTTDLHNAIQTCMLNLPDGMRSTLILCDIEGYDYAEIATVLSVSLGTVKSRMNRARRKMQDCLRGFKELLPRQYR